jgi:hypothetical protein
MKVRMPNTVFAEILISIFENLNDEYVFNNNLIFVEADPIT